MTDPRALLAELAVPRLPGTPGNARVRAVLTRELAARGFVVIEHAFAATPVRLIGAQIWGAALGAGIFATVALALVPGGSRWLAIWTPALLGALVWLVLAAGRGLPLPTPPVAAANLIAVRPRTRVTVWLTAHYDSKGQPLSMAGRLVAVALCATGCLGLLALTALRLELGWHPAMLLPVLPGILGALLLSRCRVSNDSAGAVDNAAALVTVLGVVDALPAATPVGVLFPDAEEFGLAGAHALVRERANLLADTAVVNLDGIDDAGPTRVLRHRPGPVGMAVAAALGVRPVRFLPALVDGLALAPAARECVTVLRGGWRTARRVHTPRDTPDRLTLAGSRAVAQAIAVALSRV
ncbi:MAG: hypothetical protein AUH42_01980 [Gemmatimonadetes bacterium 13_1_40CM_70_11]|nr:MAG: hypothetical protein AUH42_01980 [Gemmatimonadetes bacterium 13_1_40CM_70_11]